jgi:hypothetical protein
VRRAPNDLEDYGYLLEQVVLYATELDLAGSWVVRDSGIPLPDKDTEYVATWVATS